MSNKLIGSFAAKTAALVLAVLTLLASLGLAASAAVAIYLAGATGTTDAARERAAERVLYRYAEEVAESYYYLDDLEKYSAMPFTYTILDENGETLASTHTGAPYLAKTTYHFWYTEWVDEETYLEKRVDAVLYADYSMHGEGWLPLIVNLVAGWHEYRFLLLALAVVSFLLFAVLAVFLHRAAGWHSGEETPRCNAIDRLPFDAYTALYAGFAVAQVMLLAAVADGLAVFAVFLAVFGILDVFLLLGYTMSIATRVKTHTLWSNTLLGRLLRFVRRGAGTVWRHLPVLWQAMVAMAALLFVELLFLLNGELDNMAVFWAVKNLALVPFLLLLMLGLRRLQNGIRQIASGRVEHQVDTRYLPGALRDAAQDINHIGDGLSGAVEARLKSERFKTELITNVSHDIKTPLTSIINYVDLLQKEQPENETMREYLSVLERQSARLKKLIEDLVEASKASTGSLAVHPAPCELSVLLEQTVGEYTEKATAAGLTILLNCPDAPVTVLADGKHLWRVFDNLMNNVCKYAQPDTRVYLDLAVSDGGAQVTFRNISRAQLNISGEELMERFVRGDSSRNTEGSGLGLSIARSLTELQGGTLAIAVDGDLFKVIVTLPVWESTP